MATKTDKYELRKKEDNDFYNIDDFNDNMDKIETALTEFDDSGSADGITSFTDMLTKLVTGNKLAVTLRNLKAGLQFVLHTGSIVNNCVTDNAKLPLSAAQGKALQDAITKLNGDLGSLIIKERIISEDITIPANSGGKYEVNVYKDGYTPLGIVGIAVQTLNFYPYEWNLGGNNAYVFIFNKSSSYTGHITLTILYSKAKW